MRAICSNPRTMSASTERVGHLDGGVVRAVLRLRRARDGPPDRGPGRDHHLPHDVRHRGGQSRYHGGDPEREARRDHRRLFVRGSNPDAGGRDHHLGRRRHRRDGLLRESCHRTGPGHGPERLLRVHRGRRHGDPLGDRPRRGGHRGRAFRAPHGHRGRPFRGPHGHRGRAFRGPHDLRRTRVHRPVVPRTSQVVRGHGDRTLPRHHRPPGNAGGSR